MRPASLDDTLIMAWLLDSASRSLGLKALAADLLGWQMTELTELIGTGRKQITMDQVPVRLGGGLLRCRRRRHPSSLRCAGSTPAGRRSVEALPAKSNARCCPCSPTWRWPAYCSTLVFLGEMSGRLGKRLTELEIELHQVVGHAFNIRSTQQLSQVLFEELALPDAWAQEDRLRPLLDRGRCARWPGAYWR